MNVVLPKGWRECPTCKGTGINPQFPINVCPKCKGERRVLAGGPFH